MTATPTAKKWHLSKEEMANVQSRRAIAQQHDYTRHVVQADMHQYIQSVVFKRLNIADGTVYTLSEDGTYIEEMNKPPESMQEQPKEAPKGEK